MSAPDFSVFDDRRCELGEGALWHPLRGTLLWFDILGCRLLENGPAGPRDWPLPEMSSAAGWVDRDSLLIASETGLWNFSLVTGGRVLLCPLEADRPETRSNDGRADPHGGFWIGTMGKAAEAKAGAIYRWHRGELRQLFAGLTIPNAICFAPGGRRAYFSDTSTARIETVALDDEGWPVGSHETFIDLSHEGLSPDGAVTDSDGNLWVAQWGCGRVVCYAPDGRLLRALAVEAPHCTCPAFGGPDFGQLFVTSAQQGLSLEEMRAAPLSGATFVCCSDGTLSGRPEPAVQMVT